ncbi:MAG: Na+/H+ antiporter subunit E [Firmicutes bacterium]|nr:Na+/H+ antiporter subunit E [Bacillota bacterium]
MTPLLANVLLALAWMAVTGRFTAANFAVGFLLGFVALRVAGGGDGRYGRRLRLAFSFAFFYLWELLLANLRVAYDVVTRTHHMRPGILAIPLDVQTDAEITLFANLITLTPGTLSLDVSPDRRVLYIHAMYIDDVEAFRQRLKQQLERRVLELFR